MEEEREDEETLVRAQREMAVHGVPVAGDYPYVHYDEGKMQVVQGEGEVRMCIYRGNERDDEKNGGEGSKEKTRSESDGRRNARRKEGK